MDMNTIIELASSGVGGAILGPIISKLLGGKGATGALAGLVGGIAGGFGMDAANLQMLGGSDVMNILNNLLQGGIGGGVIGGILGLLTKAK